MHRRPGRRVRPAEAGMSLIELMISMIVLVVGMMGIMVMISMAITTNARNKMDTTATALSQMVIEAVASQSVVTGTPFTVTDCNPVGAGGPQVWTVNTVGVAAPGAGAPLDANGNMDFTVNYAAVPANYKMQFVSCGSGGRQTTYEVRWNVTNISAFSKLVTVSSRQIGATATSATFTVPVTLRTIAGF